MKLNDLIQSVKCFVVVTKELLESILETQNEILRILKNQNEPKSLVTTFWKRMQRKNLRKVIPGSGTREKQANSKL